MTEAFLSNVMDAHGDCVYRLALCRLQNKADAEDAFQDTFLAFFQEKNTAAWDVQHIKAWLLRVAMNKCNDIARRRKKRSHAALEDVAQIPGSDMYGYIDLWDAVNHLPEKQRLVFHLHYGEGMKTEDIAQVLKMTGSAVRVTLNRARMSLRKELREDG